jgi:hypothetical protein
MKHSEKNNMLGVNTQKQRQPRLHPVFLVPVDEDVSATLFDTSGTEWIRNRLVAGVSKPDPAKLTDALNATSRACYQYANADSYWFVSPAHQEAHAKSIRDVAKTLDRLLNTADPKTRQRLAVYLGAISLGKNIAKVVERDEEDRDEKYMAALKHGEDRYPRMQERIQNIAKAGQYAAGRADVPVGRPPSKTPPLERSLVHRLAEIWCVFRQEPFKASKLSPLEVTKVRPDQRSSAFVEEVIRQAKFDPSAFDFVRLNEMVRKERQEAGASTDTFKESADSASDVPIKRRGLPKRQA